MTPTPVVETESGRLRGRSRGDVLEFLGIPYARARRFAPPSGAAPWPGTQDATAPGPVAPQPDRAVARFTHGPIPAASEDCLNLNVWTPGTEGRRPVLVWIHGGGFAIGHGAASLYHGGVLAAAGDLVVVTLNYRLGSLGWLGHPRLAAGPAGPAANWGLLDQIAALRWVSENISAFGGDPSQVTVAGQSAGALCAMDMLVAPGAEGLFRRAILQSPPMSDVAQAPEIAHGWAEALSRAAGSGELKDLPAERIVALHEELLDASAFRGTRGGALPTLDPATVPASPREVPGASPDVEILIGANADEGTFFFGSPWRPAPPAERIPAIIAHLTGEDTPATAGAESSLEHLRQIATARMIAGPAADWAAARSAALGPDGVPVYQYRFNHPGAGPDLRATHTAEVPLIFGTWQDGGAGERLGGQPVGPEHPATAAVATAVSQAWIGFARGEGPGWMPQDLQIFGRR